MPTTKRSRADLDLSKIDWSRADKTTDREIERQVGRDKDTAPILSRADLAAARKVRAKDLSQDVRALRQHLGLSQREFAARFGFSVSSVRNWEQGHRQPEGPARILLQVIAREPDAVTRALTSVK